MMVTCQRCGCEIPSLNKLRKWCVDCRKVLTNERAKERNKKRRAESSPESSRQAKHPGKAGRK